MRINGKKVVDATKSLRITITEQDATAGKTKDPGGCAAALAIVRGYKKQGATGARVHIGRTYIEYPDKFVRYETPKSLRAEIISFDRGNSPKFMAGEYSLRRICPSGRLNARPKPPGPSATRNTTHKQRRIARVRHQIEGVRAHGANR